MDQSEFDDLFETSHVNLNSSQHSLTASAGQLTFCESDEEVTSDVQRLSPVLVPDDTIPSEEYETWKQQASESLGIYEENRNDQHLCNSMDNVAPSCLRFSAAQASPYKPEASCQGQEHITVIQRIERVFQKIRDSLHHETDDVGLTLKVRTSTDDISRSAKTRRLSFPGRTAEEAWRFAVVMRVLELIHEALRTGVTISKRDIYYRDVALFGTQAVVDRYVDDIGFTFNVPRSALNVAAAAKGLLVGKINFCRRDGSSVDCGADRDGMLIPDLRHILSANMKAVKWIIVIEKEASFRSLANSSCWDRLSAECVLMTGKGYPDLATRAMLRFLSTPSPHNGFSSPVVFGLADYDPDGIAILDVYKHGSAAMRHENLELKVGKLSRLGLSSRHITTCRDAAHADQALLTLTARDRSKACKMLERCSEDGRDDEGNTRLVKTTAATPTASSSQTSGGQDGVVTVTRTSVDTTTVKVTVTPSIPAWDVSTKTNYCTTTITTYVENPGTTETPQTRQAWRMRRGDGWDDQVAAVPEEGGCAAAAQLARLSAISSIAPQAIPHACSCAGFSIPTTTRVSTVTAAATNGVSQGAADSASTTTILMAGHATVSRTVQAGTTISTTTTTDITSTSTVTLAAPTYTQVYGPESGCSIRENAQSEQLDNSITDSNEASERCQTSCSQKSECSFVFAQQLFPDYGQTRPHFQCYFIGHHFNETQDLQCGQSERIWGEACGFDAEGRGQPSTEKVSKREGSWWKW
ncbi:DNA replication licensing factor [Hortaea werneckii]|nr:DNA replication licensing factor [Hortaea werneckii]